MRSREGRSFIATEVLPVGEADPSPEDVVTRLLEAVLELTLQTVAVSQEEPKKKEAVTCTVCQKKFWVKGNLGRQWRHAMWPPYTPLALRPGSDLRASVSSSSQQSGR